MNADDFAASATGLYGRLARCVFGMCGDRALAEEAAQEALVRAWERVDAGDDELASLEAWTVRVALNWSRSQLRRSGAHQRALDKVGARSTSSITDDHIGLDRDVHRAVLALPDRQREVVVLHYLLDLDVGAIAGITGTSKGAVKNALFHGRAALAERLHTTREQRDQETR